MNDLVVDADKLQAFAKQVIALEDEVARLRHALARETEFVRKLQIERLELQARLDEYIATRTYIATTITPTETP